MMDAGRKESGRKTQGSVWGFLTLYAALYGAYGCVSPILPNFLAARGLAPEQVGLILAGAGAVRLAAGPLVGRFADRRNAGRGVLVASAALAGLAAFAHLPGQGLWTLLPAALAYALGTASLAPLADALAVGAARSGVAFQYGWVRGAGSAAFIAATGAAGWLVQARGLGAGLLAGGGLFLAAAAAARTLPTVEADGSSEAGGPGFAALFRLARFRRTVLAAALVLGAHAMHDAFAMILWRASGIGAGAAGLLWSEAVAAEVFVFLVAGPPLLARIGSGGGVALAAAAGALRWAVQAETVALPAIAGIQLLHGLSFALLHLACLGLIEGEVPRASRATALTLYGTVGLGLAGVATTLASGSLYAAFQGRAFWAMAALSLAALPVALSLRAKR